MATKAKATTAAAGATAKAKPKRVTALPSMRFHYPPELKDKTDTVLTAVEVEPHHAKHADAIADLVTELIDAGMEDYFLKALKLAEVGFIAEQSARLGMSGAVKLISSISRKYIVRMDKAQLLVIATHIRSLASPD